MTSGFYVYAIVSGERSLPEDVTGMSGAALALVRCGNLAAIVGRVETDRIRPSATNVVHHESVVETLRRSMPLLPVRFGTVLPDVEAIVRSLDERSEQLASDLARLGGTFEFGLLVRWTPPAAGAPATPAPAETVASAAGAAGRPGAGRRYMQERAAEHQRERALRAQAEHLAGEIDVAVAGLAIDQRRLLVPTPQLAVRASYLVGQGAVEEFRDAFDQLRRARPELSFLLSGPWPPYSFVTQPERSEESMLQGWRDLLRQIVS